MSKKIEMVNNAKNKRHQCSSNYCLGMCEGELQIMVGNAPYCEKVKTLCHANKQVSTISFLLVGIGIRFDVLKIKVHPVVKLVECFHRTIASDEDCSF